MTQWPVIRRATAADIEPSSRTLARAFQRYPWTAWTVEAQDRPHRLERLFRLNLEHLALPYGEVWVTDDCRSVAVWLPPEPGGALAVAYRRLAPQVDALLGDRADAATEAEEAVAVHRPGRPHWHLATIGTDPGAQGRGLASAVLAPVLRRCDDTGVAAYLDTCTARNVALYRRLGFDVVAEVDVPGGGPHVWLMWRPTGGRGGT